MTAVFWNKKIQEASAEELRRLQLKLLKWQVRRVYENSAFYHKKFKEMGVKPSEIRSLEDIAKLPYTSREELEANFNDILAVPKSEIATIRMTSGTTGHPLKVAHTKRDVEMVTEASARKLTYHGVTKDDIVQVTASYGLWQGAWSVHWGAEKIGACVIPVGPGDTERQILLIKQLGTTVLYGVSIYHFRILEVAKALGEDLKNYSLRIGICVAEKPSQEQIHALMKGFGYEKVAIDYGATEFPGFSVHCETERDFHHVWADFYLIEVVDPETREPLEEGERGELVITSLQREAFPLIRYLSRDVTDYVGFEKCTCGMSHPKLGVNIDRTDFMAKIRGVIVFPGHLEAILSHYPGLTGRCQIIVDKRTPKHEATLKVEINSFLSKALQESIKEKLIEEVKNRVGITLNEVTFVPSGTFEDKFRKTVVIT
ncbi:MAG: AMP-binding protein [Candidatus Bathyarchaeia archaeon]